MEKQTISRTMVYPSCPKPVNQYNRMDPSRDAPNWKINPMFQQGTLRDPMNEMYNKNDITNSAQCKQVYGDTSYPYINRDTYSQDYNKINDIERVTQASKYLPYYLPDKTQYPTYQWQKDYSSFRKQQPFRKYYESSVKRMSEVQTEKTKKFNPY